MTVAAEAGWILDIRPDAGGQIIAQAPPKDPQVQDSQDDTLLDDGTGYLIVFQSKNIPRLTLFC